MWSLYLSVVFFIFSANYSNFTDCCEISFKPSKNVLKRIFFDIENDKTILELIETVENKIKLNIHKKELKKIKKINNGTFIAANTTENISKNRYNESLCFDHTRVILPTENGSSDYINANYVDGYKQKNKFIMTQGL